MAKTPKTSPSAVAHPDHARFAQVLDGHDDLLIFCHMNPDPDSIASGLAMKQLLEARFGKSTTICYRGIIGRAQNREMVRLLAPDLKLFRDIDPLDYDGAVLVDAQPEFGFSPEDLSELEQELPILVCIDHHPFVASTGQIPYHDVRPGYGANSTVMTNYLRVFSVVPSAAVATALYYGIKTDTLGLTRRTTEEDREAFEYLRNLVDHQLLEKIESPPLSGAYFRDLRDAIDHARVYEDLVLSWLQDPLAYPDLVAEIADLMLRYERASWAVCLGRFEDKLVMSVRTSDADGDAGVFIRGVVGDLGQAGGHNTMAAARLPLDGADARSYEILLEKVRSRILERFSCAGELGERLAGVI